MPYTLLPSLLLQMLIVGYTPGPANFYREIYVHFLHNLVIDSGKDTELGIYA